MAAAQPLPCAELRNCALQGACAPFFDVPWHSGASSAGLCKGWRPARGAAPQTSEEQRAALSGLLSRPPLCGNFLLIEKKERLPIPSWISPASEAISV